MKLPEGFEWRHTGRARGFARAALAGWLEEVLSSGRTLHGWAAEQPGAQELQGRGVAYAVAAPAGTPDGPVGWVVRHYHRGGALASVLEDRYLAAGLARPLSELLASEAARARGVRTPMVLAGAVYPAGACYRADLVTARVPAATDLSTALFGLTPAAHPAPSALRAAGVLVRELEDACVLHPDLNAGNVLLSAAVPVAHVIDLDRCRILPAGAARPGPRMRNRLERSLRKLAARHRRPLDPAEWEALRAGFEGRPA